VSKRDAVDRYFSTKPQATSVCTSWPGLQMRLERKGELAVGTVLLGAAAERGARKMTWSEHIFADSDNDDDC